MAGYDPAKRGVLSSSPAFNFGPRLFPSSITKVQDRGLQDVLKNFEKSINAMREALKVLGCGLDYQRYAKFRQLAPEVIWFLSSNPAHNHDFIHRQDAALLSADDCTFCFNFVIESALRLQEFDL